MSNPLAIDSMSQLIEHEKFAKTFGFYWDSADQIAEQIEQECKEVKEAVLEGAQEKITDELGDVLHAAISFCLYYGVDPRDALEAHCRKYTARLKEVVSLTQQAGHEDLNGKSYEYKYGLWKEAKKKVG